MSEDSGVYILKLKSGEGDEYRVAKLYAASNIFVDVLHCFSSFVSAETFGDHGSALNYALQIDGTEHGINTILKFQDYTWTDIEKTHQNRLIKAI